MGIGFITSRNSNHQIERNKTEITAIVKRVYIQNTRGETCEYEFRVDGKSYTGHKSLGKLNIEKGDSVIIEFSKKNPNYNRMTNAK